MSYSIKVFLDDYCNKDGLHKVGIRVIYNRMIEKAETEIRVKENQFDNGEIKRHDKSIWMNALIRKQVSDIEDRLLTALRSGNY